MRIGMFTDSYFPQVSGVSTSIKLLKDQLSQAGHVVIIFTTTDPHAEETDDIVRLPSVPFASFDDRRIAYRGFDRCLKIARKYNLDIIHTHTEFSLGLVGKYLASKLKIPAVHTYHTMYENYTHYIWNGKLITRQHVKWYSRFFCSQMNGVITPSKLTFQTLSRYGVKVPMKIIPTGVLIPEYRLSSRQEIRERLNIPTEDPVLLSLSRLSKEKSIDEVISNFFHIKKVYPNVHLVIVGDGPHRETLEALVRGYDLSDVYFIGEIPHDQVDDYYQMADLYLNASESESQGLTYLEAIANKLPIIAKENSYLNMIITNNSYGQLYRQNESLAEVVIEFLKKKQNGQICEINQEDLYNISAAKFGKDVMNFYQSVIDNFDEEKSPLYNRITKAAKELMAKI